MSLTEEERDGDKQWGSWLRASPRRGRIKMAEEVKAFRSCARRLNYSNPSSISKTDTSVESKGATSPPLTASVEMRTLEQETFHSEVSLDKPQPCDVSKHMGVKSTIVKELGEGVSKCEREFDGLPPKCARKLGTLEYIYDAPTVTHEEVAVEEVPMPTLFNVGIGGKSGKKTKKIVKKSSHTRPCHVILEPNGMNAGKRKTMCPDSELDGDDIRMTDSELREKKTKLSSDIIDGNSFSLTVAEVGISQCREGQ